MPQVTVWGVSPRDQRGWNGMRGKKAGPSHTGLASGVWGLFSNLLRGSLKGGEQGDGEIGI